MIPAAAEVSPAFDLSGIPLPPASRMVIVSTAEKAATLCRAARAAFPAAEIHLLSTGRKPLQVAESTTCTPANTVQERAEAMLRLPGIDLVLESGNHRKGQKRETFRRLFGLLPDGGSYLVDRWHLLDEPELADVSGETLAEFLSRITGAGPHSRLEGEIGRSVAEFGVHGDVGVLRKRGTHLPMLRQAQATSVLTNRFGDHWGEEVLVRPAESYQAPRNVFDHGPGGVRSWTRISVPDLPLRRYRDPVVHPRQVISYADVLLPDTFRHPQQRHLNHRDLRPCGPHAARHLEEPAEPRPLEGSYFHLDTEFPNHYGHAMTEVISRFWAWEAIRERDPDVRALVSMNPEQTVIPGFQKQLLDALGCDSDRLVAIKEPVRPEVLYAAAPGFALPRYASRSLAGLWQQVATTVGAGSQPGSERIFVSRRSGRVRCCHQLSEVEDYVRDLGFQVIYPEDHPFAEQIRLFRDAEAIAGWGGSGMFSMAFASRAPVAVLSSNSYTANNEYLIAAAKDMTLHCFWGESDRPHPPTGYDLDAERAGFSLRLDTQFDEEFRSALRL